MKRNGKKILFLISMIVLVALVHAQYYDENYYSTRDYNNGYYAGYNSDIYRSYQPPTNNLNENTNQNQPAYQNQYYSGSSYPSSSQNAYNSPQNSQYGYSSGSNYYQSSFPNSGYGGHSSGFSSQYWPQLRGGGVGGFQQCDGTRTDFLIQIPPGGCTPNVVRSDLLAEQNVPVFCKLSTLKLNPLIDASAIQSISFAGEYPQGVAGISYHPAREAIRSYNTVLSGPAIDEAGYVVISLSRQPDERDLPDFLEGNVTARIRYDARQLIGTSHAEYYLEAGDGKVPFWHGKGFLEVESVDRGVARINVYTDLNSAPYQSLTLREGGSGPVIHMPGYYCTAGARVVLNRVVSPDDMALLNVEGDQIWVREGSRFYNNLCQVRRINILPDGAGSIDISCAGKSITLELRDRGVAIETQNGINEYRIGQPIVQGQETYYLAYYGSDPQGRNFVILTKQQPDQLELAFVNDHYSGRDWSNVNARVFEESLGDTKEGKERIGTFNEDYFMLYTGTATEEGSTLNGIRFNSLDNERKDIDRYGLSHELRVGTDNVEQLVEFYPTEEKLDGTFWGEEALYHQILIAGKGEHYKTEMELIELFEQEYPQSDFLLNVLDIKRKRTLFDASGSHANVQVNNEHFSIFVESFRAQKDFDTSATIRIGGRSAQIVRENEEIEFDNGKLVIERIDVQGVFFRFESLEGETQGQPIGIDQFGNLGGREIEVRDIESRQVAYVSVVPQVNQNQISEASFAFRIGIEDRNIELNPDKAKDAIRNLNRTIAGWEDILDKLGNVIKTWKAVCFSTSTILMLQTTLDGFDGESLARNKVMTKYKTICDTEIAKGTYKSRTECYNALSSQVDADVENMKQSINKVNEDLKRVQEGNKQSNGLFGGESILNQTQYVEDLKRNLEWEGVDVDGVTVETKDLTKSTEVSSILLYKNLGCNVDETVCAQNLKENVACCAAYDEMKANLGSAARQKRATEEGERASEDLKEITGGVDPRIQIINSPDVQTKVWGGLKGKDIPANLPADIGPEDKIQYFNGPGKSYLAKLRDATLGGTMGIEKAWVLDSNKQWVEVSDLSEDGLDKVVFSGGSRNACEGNVIKNPQVRYYEFGRNKGLPSIVPFDVQNGWYAYVPNSQGSILEGTLATYTAAGDVNFFWICNVGDNGILEHKGGDDLCQSFSANQRGFDTFISCGLQGPEVGKIYAQARDAIRQAAQGYGSTGYVSVNGQSLQKGDPVSDIGGAECQDFMSPDNCRMLFNACDPVICPSSRCDLGGKYPVADVVQTGIVGSIALCLPNAREGIIFPVCLTGVHAGIDSFVSILKSEKACLEHNLETGEYVGICDEITAIYMCEFFWRQFGSVLDVILPSFFEVAFGQQRTHGGGEYLNIQSAFDNLEKSTEFFTGFYAENAITSFSLKNPQNVGVNICNGFLGTSVPLGLSAEGFDALLSPQSPTQFYAYFSETPFTGATSPATSHYKVYYHIYAGNDFGASYQVYLKDPSIASTYSVPPVANVRTGFVPRGESADESIDFTAPAGYKELCVRINNQEHCGFGSVTSNFAINYASEQYTLDQAKQTDITTEQACVSTTPSAWALAAPNIQSGAEKAIGGRDINLAGITRVCASQNPEIGIAQPHNQIVCSNDVDCGAGYTCEKNVDSDLGNCVDVNGNRQQGQGRWIDVGYCGNPDIRCWLDSTTLQDRFNAIDAVNQEFYGAEGTVEDYLRYGQLFDETRISYEIARARLSDQYNKIRALTPQNLRGGESDSTIAQILIDLDVIIGIYGGGQGTANNRAEAYALKATVYRMIVAQKLRDATDIFGTGPQLIPLIDGTVGIPERIGEGYPDQGGAPGPDLSDDENSVLEEIEGTLDDTTLPPPLNIRTIAGKDYIAQGSTPSNMYIHEGNRIVMQPLEGNPVFVGVIEEDGRIVILEGHKNEGLFGLTLEALDGLYFDGQGFSVR